MKKLFISLIVIIAVIALVLIGLQVTEKTQKEISEIKNCGEGTVIYKNDKLCWQQSIMPSKPKNWQEANDYCNNLILGGKDDWRLPTEGELLSIIDTSFPKVAINPEYFKDTLGVPFWTSTPGDFNNSHKFINFQTGYRGSTFDFTKDLSVRCVRDRSMLELSQTKV